MIVERVERVGLLRLVQALVATGVRRHLLSGAVAPHQCSLGVVDRDHVWGGFDDGLEPRMLGGESGGESDARAPLALGLARHDADGDADGHEDDQLHGFTRAAEGEGEVRREHDIIDEQRAEDGGGDAGAGTPVECDQRNRQQRGRALNGEGAKRLHQEQREGDGDDLEQDGGEVARGRCAQALRRPARREGVRGEPVARGPPSAPQAIADRYGEHGWHAASRLP